MPPSKPLAAQLVLLAGLASLAAALIGCSPSNTVANTENAAGVTSGNVQAAASALAASAAPSDAAAALPGAPSSHSAAPPKTAPKGSAQGGYD